MQPIGLFGGTFDPIHCGHLRTAFELWQELGLAEVRFLPTGSPPHRAQLHASAELRLKMVQAAVADQAGFVVDDREVRRTGFSYSVDTLTELRALIIAGRDPRYLVPDAVRQIILETRCYAPPQDRRAP